MGAGTHGAVAVIVVGAGAAAVNLSGNGSVVSDSRHDGTDGKTVRYIAAMFACDTAETTDANDTVSRSKSGGADTTADGAADTTIAHHTAVTSGVDTCGMDGNIAAYTAIFNNAANIVIP